MKLILQINAALILVWLFVSIAVSFRSSDFYTRQNFHHFNSELTDLNAAKIPKSYDPRNPCPWPEYPHVAGRYCERRCGENPRDTFFHSDWCEKAEAQAEIRGDDYKCICPRRLARHANGSCVPLTHCPAEFLPKCGENETLTDCPSHYYDCANALPYLQRNDTHLPFCVHSSTTAAVCVCRHGFFRSPELNSSCVRYEDCPLFSDNLFELALRKALAAESTKCPGDYEVPRCDRECEDLHCANLTDVLDEVKRLNHSRCTKPCENASYGCRCRRGLVRHNGRCLLPENCPRSSFPECPENEQLNFYNGTNDAMGCPERNCSEAVLREHQPLNSFTSTATDNGCGPGRWRQRLVQTMLPRCWCPRTHYRNSTGACINAEECQTDPAYARQKTTNAKRSLSTGATKVFS